MPKILEVIITGDARVGTTEVTIAPKLEFTTEKMNGVGCLIEKAGICTEVQLVLVGTKGISMR